VAGATSKLARPDRGLVDVGAGERRALERPRHDDRGRAVPAADVGDGRAGPQLVDHAVERRQPLGDQVGGVAGPEEPLDPGEQPRVVGVPADPGAGAERVDDQVVVGVAGGDGLERAGQEDRAVLVGEDHGVLGGQVVGAVGRVVADVATGGLVGEPFAHVALGRAGPLRERGRGDRPGSGHRLVQAQPVAQVQQQPGDGRAHVDHRLPDEGLELRAVRGRDVGRRHSCLRSSVQARVIACPGEDAGIRRGATSDDVVPAQVLPERPGTGRMGPVVGAPRCSAAFSAVQVSYYLAAPQRSTMTG
jgi:hypothetical protein